MADIKKYVPKFLRDVEDLKQIWDSESETLSAIWNEVDLLVKRQFVLTADETQIAYLERFLGLPLVDLDLEQRRERIMAMYRLRDPLTYARLEQAMASVCDNFEIIIDDMEQQIIVTCNESAHDAALQTLRAIVPTNLEIVLNTYPPQPLRGFWGASFYGYDFFLEGGGSGWL
jgi:hypothetical protein